MTEARVTVIRASALSAWPDCNRRQAARMFRREIRAAGFSLRDTQRGIGAAIGSAVHDAARVTLAEKARSGSLPPVAETADWAEETLRENIADGIAYDGPKGATHNRDEALRQTVSMARAYHRVVAPAINPILVEERLEAEVTPGLVLSGQPDLVAREPNGIHDLKTGARQYPGAHAPQIGAYSLLARTHDIDIEYAALDFIRRASVTRPQPDPVSVSIPVAPAETAAVRILDQISRDLSTFRNGDEQHRIQPGDPWSFSANPSSILCSEKWCPAYGVTGPHAFCREWAPKKGEDS